ncbi:MAG: DUF1800 domain-containing protein [Phycisphaerae bacterium]|jgi:uncharacterized protein (DUF1800 family)|nr:DUF1800 domain-containing protein [Phycisphaerae bacterium]MBT5409190.1 DUF1800 domain-containing protein [Phycisphaerae bacterium]MBT6165157.1 DUF1800 domain-containing protein [Phycisphaerae bacterium]MBT7657726.1 DUF1800 domain-containing protein [Phycisphaerae bacterium]
MTLSSVKPLDPKEFDERKAQHLLQRAGFGGTTKQAVALSKLGLEKAVEYIVEYNNITDPEPVLLDAYDKDIIRPLTAAERKVALKARQDKDEDTVDKLRKERQRRQREDRKQISEMELWWLQRMVSTPRPLEEKLTLFWHGHFATGYRTIEDSYQMYLQNNFFRKNAMGNFKEDLVRGIIHDPAMIKYLNNHQNRKQAPNENLARELMELFTLGEGEGYDEDDIKEGARCLTGYTVEDHDFTFNSRNHDTGQKRIFGRSGYYDGDDFVDLIFTRPNVAKFIVNKLYRYFVNDLPHGKTADSKKFTISISNLLKRKNWELKPILKTIFLSEHFYDDSNMQAIIKSPVQLIVQATRSLNPPQRRKMVQTLAVSADLMGQRLFAPPSVKGWDGGRMWINTSTMFMRQNTLLYLLTGQRPGSASWEADNNQFNGMALVEGNTRDPKDAITFLLTALLNQDKHDRDRVASLENYMKTQNNTINNETVTGLLTLITAMPEYQLC